MKTKILPLLFSLICLNGFAQTAKDDYLEPDDGIFSFYSNQFENFAFIRSILFKGLAESPRVRYLVMPAFAPEFLWQIERDPQSHTNSIVVRFAKENIWEANDKSKIEVETSRNRLSQDDAELIEQLFLNALLKTQFVVHNTIVLDGATYYFSVNESRRMSGHTSNPRGPNMRQLVTISRAIMNEVSSSTFVELSAPLRTQIKELSAALIL